MSLISSIKGMCVSLVVYVLFLCLCSKVHVESRKSHSVWLLHCMLIAAVCGSGPSCCCMLIDMVDSVLSKQSYWFCLFRYSSCSKEDCCSIFSLNWVSNFLNKFNLVRYQVLWTSLDGFNPVTFSSGSV